MIGQNRIAGLVMTYNEEDNIVPCLKSLRWVDELIVIDSFSTDSTVELAKQHADRVVQHPYECYSKQLEYSLSLVNTEWAAYLDADERFTDEAVRSIRSELESAAPPDACRFPRLTWFMNRWIRHSGWYPKPRIRLFRKSQAYVAGEEPHINIGTRGTCKTLKGDVLHLSYRGGLSHMIRSSDTFTNVAAGTRWGKGTRASILKMLFAPQLVFMKKYILQLGFLDGMAGYFIAFHSAYYEWCKQAKLWEIGHLKDPEDESRRSPLL